MGGGSKRSVEAWLKVKYLVREKEGLSQRREEEKGRRVRQSVTSGKSLRLCADA